jgi:DNA-directed RNA polymerase subunit M/transcription elongation factor TFIIS
MTQLQKTAALFSGLSSSEKGYLKKYFKTRLTVLQSRKSEQFLELFTSIDAKSTPSEKFLPEIVNEVFIMIIAGLEEYHKNDTTLARSYINQVEILLEKNLNVQAEKLLAKAKKLCRKCNNREMLYEIIEWQVAIHSLKAPTDKNMKIFDEYFGELEEVLQDQSEKFEIQL